jgi:hypothetical protein
MGNNDSWGGDFGKHGDVHGGIPDWFGGKMEMKKGPAGCGASKSCAMNSRVL